MAPSQPRDLQAYEPDMAGVAQFVRMPIPQNFSNTEASTGTGTKLKKDVWKDYRGEVEESYDTLLKGWQKEMDNLLVFGGLFAAVLTPFNVESYKSLQPEPTDSSLAILERISTQLASFSINSAFINSTTPALPLADLQDPFHPSKSAVLINHLWFSSLICSLASASIALTVKQWLHDLSSGLTGGSRQAARRRQYRYKALKKWRVRTIILVPSFLLQAALILFLSGLLVLLWTLHSGVAAVSSTLASILFLFLVTVAILPVFFRDCCYGSAQAKIVYSILYPIISPILGRVTKLILHFLQRRASSQHLAPLLSFLYNLLQSGADWSPGSTWTDRAEPTIIHEGKSLDCSTAVMAVTTTLDEDYIKHLPIILPDLPARSFVDVFQEILGARWPQLEANATEPLPVEEQHNLERFLIQMLGCLLTNPHFAISASVSPDVRRSSIAPTCCLLLERLPITASVDKDGVFEVLVPALELHSIEVTRLTYNTLLAVLDLWDTGAHLSYASIHFALSTLENILTQWRTIPMSYSVAINRQLRAVRGIILCVLEALSTNTLLSSEETGIVCDHAKHLLLIFVDNWTSGIRDPEWQRLLTPSPDRGLDPTSGQNSHSHNSLSHDLQQYLWSPLSALCKDPQGYIVVPGEMTQVLKTALSYTKVLAAPGQVNQPNTSAGQTNAVGQTNAGVGQPGYPPRLRSAVTDYVDNIWNIKLGYIEKTLLEQRSSRQPERNLQPSSGSSLSPGPLGQEAATSSSLNV